MRDIKFRAWDKQARDGKGMMRRVAELNFRNLKGELYRIEVIGFGPDYNEHLTVDSAEIMQFTGLRDKNGKEIYEGDVLSIGQNSNAWILPVVFEDGMFGVKHPNAAHIVELRAYSNPSFINTVKVIGNIYENRELIEESK